ncbi:OrdA protein [Coprinopsis cinerea okayama7|uniref:OrdA protein n=1 Tax=Coprinopsis cinerea (strain Okayama-7 / 130 / ATCC MYA-4618 / FGSC 9003) TaxID=240176 RepID=A8NLB4_COPC7|nr:OrdA protein [Coprinopsis cinerea okayama7\|eukprot:XP_001834644.1 OrdA protein [Coprinopsis cinerea okayama7\
MTAVLADLKPFEIGLLGLGGFILHSYLQSGKKNEGALPPGPRGLPVVGNVLDMPKEKEWLTFAEWGKKYGGLCSIKLLGRPVIIVNSMEALEELDKKSAIYSQRPRLPMGGELVGYDNTLVLLPYGPRFRHYRKQFARYIGNGNITTQHDLVDGYTRRFLARIAKDQSNLIGEIRKLAGSVILRITYGYEVVQDGNDPLVDLIEGANENFNAATLPGAFVVDFFPSLLNLPEWLPGMGFKETARKWRKDTDAMVEVPFNMTKKQVAEGTAPPSFVSTSLEIQDTLTESERNDIPLVAASLYGGGADTTVAAEYAFYLAMVLHPEVQKKAQQEIDSVVGTDRLPTQADMANLPYTRAVISEVLRWNSVAPSGVPHVAIEEGWVGGYFIPKDAMIITNLWGILHDPEIYPDPMTFNPERFMGPNPQMDPRKAVFGWGRRICPGMYLAEASLWAVVSMSLAVFNITNVVRDGKPVIPVHDNTSGTISYPKPFECDIRPRSSKVLSLLSSD